jgi:hypothetical protein
MLLSEKSYQKVFYAAAVYNIFWGIVIALYPNLMFAAFDIPPVNYPFLVSGIGMFVGVYGYGYYVVAKYPRQYPQLVVIGLLGKVLGPIGWAYHVMLGSVPLETMWINVFNDLIWIPFFISYLFWLNRKVEVKNYSLAEV